MSSKFTSPYARTFTTAVKKGTPCSTVVWNISKKTRTPVNTIWNSLWKAGCCKKQKVNGTWVYWPNFNVKTAKNTTKTTKWQAFVEWCVFNGWCTPGQLTSNAKTAASFSQFNRKFFGFTTTTTKRTTKRRTNRKTGRKSNTTAKKHWNGVSKNRTTTRTQKTWGTGWNQTYKFPTAKSRNNSTTRRYRHAA